jgi:hypothetical protein
MKFRQPLKITSRTSSIANSFVQAIVPTIEPTKEELIEALKFFDMTPESTSCVYCGAPTTDLDHLRPLVRNKLPTGFLHEIRNLVPACGPCNQSKSGKEWREWMQSDARGSPKTKGVPDLKDRIKRLGRFEKWGALTPIALDELADQQDWKTHWGNLEIVLKKMRRAQLHADQMRTAMRKALKR